jgi:hypothetical protein
LEQEHMARHVAKTLDTVVRGVRDFIDVAWR